MLVIYSKHVIDIPTGIRNTKMTGIIPVRSRASGFWVHSDQ